MQSHSFFKDDITQNLIIQEARQHQIWHASTKNLWR